MMVDNVWTQNDGSGMPVVRSLEFKYYVPTWQTDLGLSRSPGFWQLMAADSNSFVWADQSHALPVAAREPLLSHLACL